MGDCLQTHEICQLYENNSTQLRIASLPDDILTRKTPVVLFVYNTQSCDLQDYHCSFNQGQLQIWTEHSKLIFENLKPVEKSKKYFSII